ncbi:hypothetical protein B0H63DRAFT_530827 [Podospora didyma]|uniref:Apple domain-containing protein n=1 Tax=Podospora didyma TaxID=330526 RepID=A0AAE0P4K9_9PEZI|nr:hypothetical protein B0H63DRAFT_530827 [Podospora didyma]
MDMSRQAMENNQHTFVPALQHDANSQDSRHFQDIYVQHFLDEKAPLPAPSGHPYQGTQTTLVPQQSIYGGMVLLGVAVGVGVGVGVGNQGHNPSVPAAAATASSSSSSSSVSLTETPTTAPFSPPAVTPKLSTSRTSTAAKTTATASVCPGVQNKNYAASNGKVFLHICGVDYGGKGEAKDIGHEDTSTFDNCVEKCAARDDCTGAGWGVMIGDATDEHTCWMKTNLTKSHTATGSWNFAVLLAGPEPANTTITDE